ncbi:hypothetical protein FJ872_19480 [Mesorhizobium sp. B2-5-9]|uniref:hypothetical protein n=1 Tax=Mesorhizobium sp. B2-5-9 TaxID=2589921 RepID=UPI00112681CC|nr:hypothetical protein [Mesorhizobium sp. B2-5-9]TPK15181.1 hypothetical protein FJ872_19480 [Mesorhizobium sp. B2-5-9]
MATISVRWADDHLKVYGRKIDELNRKFPIVLPRIVNQVGDRAKTQVIRALTKQTGLKRKTIVKAVGDPSRANGRKLSYEMVTRGGNIRLKYLEPRETRPGATAKPWGQRQLFAGTFMKGGKFPNRHGGNFGGQVMRRLNTSGTKLTQARSGMFIPVEMTKGATAAAFQRTAGALLRERVEAAIRKLLP